MVIYELEQINNGDLIYTLPPTCSLCKGYRVCKSIFHKRFYIHFTISSKIIETLIPPEITINTVEQNQHITNQFCENHHYVSLLKSPNGIIFKAQITIISVCFLAKSPSAKAFIPPIYRDILVGHY